ncbi:trans-sulfuration enzyme family protein [Neisseria sp. Ec49-e6-T10]|uniref:trans-sulfuration enzyme family protein n=1 Tax=Neisseria sp. Ec49-e6-T10 TaxID=3140744 RepID=UPI003EC04834
MKFATQAIHTSYDPKEHNRSVMPPIYQTSLFAYEHIGEPLKYGYTRVANPSRQVLEDTMAVLEHGDAGFAFGSGMAAIDAIFRAFLRPGDTIVAVADIYGGAYGLLTEGYAQIGVKTIFVDLTDPAALDNVLDDKVKLLWLETPSNPLLRLVDIEALAKKAHDKGVVVGIDNTFATPYLQNPLDLGADVVMHSATKYLGGHSDVMAGIVVTKHKEHSMLLKSVQFAAGALLGPSDCHLVLRGIKTLALRMQRHCENAQIVAQGLQQHPSVQKVFYPGLPDHEHHQLACTQMRGFGGVVSIYLKEDTQEAANTVVKALNLFLLTSSLGGVESLVNHSYTQSHSNMSAQLKETLGIRKGLLRLSIGIEDIDDILTDLNNALDQIR